MEDVSQQVDTPKISDKTDAKKTKSAEVKKNANGETSKPTDKKEPDDIWATADDDRSKSIKEDQPKEYQSKKKAVDSKPTEESVDDIWANADDSDQKPKPKVDKKQKPEEENKRPSVKKAKETKNEDIDDIWGNADDQPETNVQKTNPVEDIWGNTDDLPKSVSRKGSAAQEDKTPKEAISSKPTTDATEPKVKKVVKKKPVEDGAAEQPKVKKIIKKKVDEPKVEEEPVEDIWGTANDDLPRRRSSVKDVPAPVEDIWASNTTDDDIPKVKEIKEEAATLPTSAPSVETEVPESKYPWRKQAKTVAPTVVEPVTQSKPDESKDSVPKVIDSEKLPSSVEENDFWGAEPEKEEPIKTRSPASDEVHH